jgi:anti-sigma-K factor RskA
MRADEHFQDLLPAYALGSLDEAETWEVAAHLANCESCSQELRAYQAVVDELPLAIARRQPPAGLKERIMQRAIGNTQAAPAMVKPQRSFIQSIFSFAPAWGLASLVLAVVLGASNFMLWQRLGRVEQAIQTDLTTLPMQGTENAPAATGLLVISRNGEYGALIVDGLPHLDYDHQYQLWLIQDGKRTSGGIFSVDEEGYGHVPVESPRPLIQFSSFGVTIEPAGGSPSPTGKKVLSGQF